MKRISWWPQLFLGVVFNMSALFGWLENSGKLAIGALLLYCAALVWTLGYDTIYALQDRADDAKIGVKSTALHLGRNALPFVAGCYGLMLALLIYFGAIYALPLPYYGGLLAVAAHLCWQIFYLNDPAQTSRAGAVFRSNQWLGLQIFLVFLLLKI
jgi:4-hydroxybenzoate polyprenyltransferase